MESSDITTTAAFPYQHSMSSPTPPPPPPHAGGAMPTSAVVLSPCAACKILRRRCVAKCVLAPYFPPTRPHKFTTAHRVFGASNIIKLLQELPESQRADAVSSMVYEANARMRDPVYGCAGAICQLQKQVSELQAQLARAQAELVTAQAKHADLLALICMEMTHLQQQQLQQHLGSLAASPHGAQADVYLVGGGGGLDSTWEDPLWAGEPLRTSGQNGQGVWLYVEFEDHYE